MEIDMRTIKQGLRKCTVFSELSGAELEQVASLALEKQCEAGNIIFREGDSVDELLVVEEGRVAVQMTIPEALGQRGRKVTVDVVSKNEIVGWSALVEPYSHTLTGVCLQKVKVLAVNGNKLRRLVQDDPSIGHKVLKQLIKVVALRLHDTRQVLISERLLTPKTE